MAGSFKLLAEAAHCSQHAFHMNGCGDCLTHQNFKEHQAKLAKVQRTTQLLIDPSNPTPRLQLIQQQMSRALAIFFSKSKNAAAQAAVKKAKTFLGKAEKQEGVIDSEQQAEIALAAFLAIKWEELVEDIAVDLIAAATTGALIGLTQLQASEELKDEVTKLAEEHAKDRAAEIVGMHYVGEKLLQNDAAKFTITAPTLDDLQDVVEESFTKNLSLAQLEEQIKTAAMFSDMRARFIAKNEVAVAQTFGNLESWKKEGSVKLINVVLGPDHIISDLCDEHAKNSPYTLTNVPLIPAHPNCKCSLQEAA